MEPNKFENQIRETLNSREIQPSKQAWDRLDALLTIDERPKKKFPWLWIAASFIGFVFVGTFLLNQQSELIITIPTNENTVVETQTILPNETEKEIEINENFNKNSEPISNHKKNVVETTNKSINATKKIDNSKENQLVENQIQEISNPLPNQPLAIENQDDEINIETKLPIQVSKIKINATSLLSQVDEELKTEYRDNVFEKISKKYKTIKTAVAERNLNK